MQQKTRVKYDNVSMSIGEYEFHLKTKKKRIKQTAKISLPLGTLKWIERLDRKKNYKEYEDA